MQIELSNEDRDLLLKVSEAALRELRVEVRRTDTPDYHDRLQAEEKHLAGLIQRLKGAGA